MSYLTQMAGLAVQNFVSAAVGMAVLAAVVRGIARRSSGTLGNFWVDLYRSLVYVLLPLAVIVTVHPRLAGRAADLQLARNRAHRAGRDADDRARPGRVADRDQAARDERRRLLQLELVRPVREPHRLLELHRDALDPAHPGGAGLHVRPDGARATARVDGVRVDVRRLRARRRDQPARGAARLAGAPGLGREHHPGPRPVGRQPGRQGGALRSRQHRHLDGRDERRLERLGQRRLRRPDAARRRGAAREPVPRRGDLRRRRLRPLRDVLLHHHRRLRRGPDGRANARVAREEDRGARDQARGARRALRADDGADARPRSRS